jgi:integrase
MLERKVLYIRHSHWRGKLYPPKSAAGIRDVDIHSSLASRLRDHIGTRTCGYVFQTSKGTPLARSNVLRRSLHKILAEMGLGKCGFHAFRRFRITHMRKERVMEVLLRIWAGHSIDGITDKYTVEALKKDVAFRTATAEHTGLGYALPERVAPIAPKMPATQIAVNA